jgi:hypothetical protein
VQASSPIPTWAADAFLISRAYQATKTRLRGYFLDLSRRRATERFAAELLCGSSRESPAMEPLPSAIDSPTHSRDKSAGSQIRIEELPAVNRPRHGGLSNDATSSLRRANTVAQSGNLIKRNLELKATRERTGMTTRIRAKDSHEVLRNAPLQRSKTQIHRSPLEARPATRKAGHFTVGSVGQNGKIFLRYDRNR